MIKAVIFDLDDTLYEEIQFVRGGFRAVASYISERYVVEEEAFYQKLLKIHDANGRGRIFDLALKDVGLYKKSIVTKLVQKYRNHKPHLKLYADTQAVLPKLKKFYKLGLITDGNQRVQRNKISALGLNDYFDVIITTVCYGRQNQKPACLPYLKAVSKLKILPFEAVYVGDNPNKDFVGAKNAGLLSIRLVRGPYRNLKLSREFEADYLIDNFGDLEAILSTFI